MASVVIGCADESTPQHANPGIAMGGSSGSAAAGTVAPSAMGAAGSAGSAPGTQATAGTVAGADGAAGSAPLAGTGGAAGMTAASGGAAGSMMTNAGMGGSAGSDPEPDAGVDAGMMASGDGPMAVCDGGKVGKSSDEMRPAGLNVSREFAGVKYLSAGTNPILKVETTLQVPAKPTARQTLFIWPGLQSRSGAADPARIGNGVLQPVLTWGGSCAPKSPSNVYDNWWISGMYVNVTTGAAGPSGCAGGDYLSTEVGDLVDIVMEVDGTNWIQSMTDQRTMKTVDFTIDLKGQDQNNVMWIVEVPSGSTVRPAADTVFTQNVLTFKSPVTSCQPSQAGGADSFTAPILSTDGLHCCYEKIVLAAKR